MSTVSWISTSVAPSARAASTSSSATSLPSTRTFAAIASSVRSFSLIGALPAPFRGVALLSAVLAALGGYALAAFFFLGPVTALTGAAGGIAGGFCSAELAQRTLRRGGTRGATAILLLGAALIAAALAFVPALGYVEIVLAVILALRLGRGGSDRFAGLRTLARD